MRSALSAQPSAPGNFVITTTTTTSSTTSSTLTNPNDGTGGSGGGTGRQTLNCNGRDYILNVPTNLNPNQPAPLVAFFHGLGDDHLNFANTVSGTGWIAASNQNGFIAMIPEHTNPNRPSFLYFNGQQFDMAATQAEMQSVYDCIINHTGARYNISRSRIHWLGFSEGGSFVNFAANLLASQLRSVAPFAGGAQRGTPNRMIPLLFVVGTQDQSYSGIQTIANQWESAGHTVERRYINGVGHLFSGLSQAVGPNNVWTWMNSR